MLGAIATVIAATPILNYIMWWGTFGVAYVKYSVQYAVRDAASALWGK